MTIPGVALPFDFQQPAWLWLCLLVPVLIVASLRSLAGLDPARRALALITRCVLVILAACCLAGVERVQRSDNLTVIFLMDRSHSVQGLQDFQEDYIRRATADVPPDDRVGLIDFARDAFLEQPPMHGGFFVPPGRLQAMPHADRTNVAAALRLAMALFPHDASKRIVLLSDGNDNMGDLLGEARRAKADGIPIDVVPLRYHHRNEVYFDRMIAPSHAEPGEQVPIRMVIHSDQRVSGTIAVYHNDQLVDMPPEDARVTLKPGPNTFYTKRPVHGPGAHLFEAVFQPDDDSMDATAVNNRASAFSFVSGKSRVLLISADPRNDQPLFDGLQSENVQGELKTTSELGTFGMLQMMNYSTIVLANVPAAAFTETQQQELATFVKDMGGGLIMLGGDEGFGAGGWIGSPIEEVMPIHFEIKQKRIIPRGALVLIMHSCEIPRGNYWGKEMAKKSVDTISSQDYIGVLAYTFSPGGENWAVPLDRNTHKAAVKARIDRMQIGDMPDFGSTMHMAFRELTGGRGRDAAQKHVIILSDGDAQPPPPTLLADYAAAKITVSTIAIGWGAHVMEAPMRYIAEATGGQYYSARNPHQLPQIFVKESKIVQRALIIDELFQPQWRQAYSEMLAGIGAGELLPPLGGMVLTSAKENPNVIIPIVRMTAEGEDPVLAHWQYELGRAVAFTSGYWPVWGQAWTPWPRFAKLWAQIVRWTMRQETPANFDAYTKVEGDRARIVIDALDKDAGYLNLLQLRANVIGPDRKASPVEFMQTGPGHYEAKIAVDQAGQYLANVQVHTAEGESLGTIRTGVSVPFSPEYRDLMPSEGLLRQTADLTGGRWLDGAPEDADIFSHDLPPTEAKRPAWEWVLAWLLLPLFLLDVAVRRLASWLALSVAVEIVLLVVLLFGMELRYSGWGVFSAVLAAEAIGWSIRIRYVAPMFSWMTHTVTVLAQAGERSAASLRQLKDARERVRDDLAEKSAMEREEEPSAPPLPPSVARRRFDAGDQRISQTAGDLQETLGGTKAKPPAGEPAARPETKEQETDTTTARLLRARTRKQRDEEENR